MIPAPNLRVQAQGGDGTCPGSHNEPGVWARLELPGCELGHPHLKGFLPEYSPFTPSVTTYPPSPVTTKHSDFQMFSGLVLKGFPPFPNTVPY